jgi:hypothetical protein
MTLSRDFSQSVRQRATRDPQFREALLAEVRNCFEDGEAEVGGRMLKKYLPATAAERLVRHGTPKARLAALANAQQITESAFLKRLVESAFQIILPPSAEAVEPALRRDRSARLNVRLLDDDRLLLRERAAARGMPTATYASLLIRAHLRRLTPLPTQELKELRSSLLAIGAIGRNLNQTARVAMRLATSPG